MILKKSWIWKLWPIFVYDNNDTKNNYYNISGCVNNNSLTIYGTKNNHGSEDYDPFLYMIIMIQKIIITIFLDV